MPNRIAAAFPPEKVVRRTLADGSVREYRYDRRQPRLLKGSLGDIIMQYRRSADYAGLSKASKRIRERAFGYMEAYYPVHVKDIKVRHIEDMRDKLLPRVGLANQLLAVMSVLMTYAVRHEYREHNPVREIKALKGGKYRRWTDEEVEFALSHFPQALCRAIILAVYTGQRQGDVLNMTWEDFDGTGILVEEQEKTKEKVWIACHWKLLEALNEWKKERSEGPILVNAFGEKHVATSFNSRFSACIRSFPELKGCVFHGLRKTAAAKLAEAGCSAHEIMAITGHRSLASVQEYTAEAEQRRRSVTAIRRLEQTERSLENDARKTTENTDPTH